MTCFGRCCLLGTLLGIGAILVLIGAVGMLIIPKIVNNQVAKQAYLGQDTNGTDSLMLKMFRDPPYDIRLQIWTVSVLNADEVVSNGAKPNVTEKGPYSFNVLIHKTNVSFAENATRLFFRNVRHYFFNPNQSCYDCKLTDTVTVPNILFQKIVDICEQHPWLRILVEAFIRNKEKVFITVPVGQLLFDGYEDKLISSLCNQTYIKNLCKTFGVPERIGLFYGQNNTDDGLYEVDTGVREVRLLDKVLSWQGMKGSLSQNYWYQSPARIINGTDTEIFPPNLFGQQKLQIFIGQLCRSFDLDYREATVSSETPVYRFAQPDSTLDADVQRSQGFCNPNAFDFFHNASIQQAGCAPSGLLDMSSCLPGAPRLFWSGAHFRNTPEGVQRSLEGLAPPSDADLSYFDIEPVTAVIVGVKQRSQLSLGMRRGNMQMTAGMRDLIVPMVWLNESATIDPRTREQLALPLAMLWGSFLGGLILICIGAVSLVCFAGIFIGTRIVANRRRLNEEQNDRTPLVSAPEQMLPPTPVDTLAPPEEHEEAQIE